MDLKKTIKKTTAKKYGRPIDEFHFRADGRLEWVCEHGVGHTVWFPKGSDAVHGCDGCCGKLKEEINEN
jgi:hypothetical protein